MPCQSSEGMGDAYREDSQARRTIERLEKRVAELEQALCGVCQMLAVIPLHPQLHAWFEKHKQQPGCIAK